jgi:hypothetical protein
LEELERLVPEPSAPASVAAGPSQSEGRVVAEPGKLDIDEEAVDRALERTLVRAGALLLPPGSAEIEPSLSYTRQQNQRLGGLTVGGQNLLAENDVRQDELEAGLELRVGLPYDSQLELDLPFRYDRASVASNVFGRGVDEGSESDAGLADVSLAFTKTLLRGEGLLPNLFGAVTWDTRTGGDELGSGFHELAGSLTATKRADPLVYVAGLSYQHAFERGDVQPGQQIGLSLGSVLAVSPESSLRFFVDQVFSDETERGGGDLAGTEQVATSLRIGLSTVLAPRLLLDVEATAGLTEDADDYGFKISLPIRFDLPFGGS